MNSPHLPIPGDTLVFRKALSPGHAKCIWLKDSETVDVQKVFKNGDAAVALHDVYAAGKDNRRTIHVPLSSLATA